MSGLIEYYARRRRAQAGKKAKQAHDEAWDVAEPEPEPEPVAPPPRPPRSSSAFTNGHVRNVRPVSRRKPRPEVIADEGVEEYVVSRNGGRDTPRDEATVFYDRIRAEDFPPTEPHATLDDDHDADELSTNGDVVIADEPVLDAQPPPPASAAGVIWHSQPRTDPTPEPEATAPDDGERGEPVAIQDESPTVELRALSIEEAEAVEPEPEQATEPEGPEVPEPEAGEAPEVPEPEAPETAAEPETANAPEPEAREAPESAAEPETASAPEPEARKAPETTEPETVEVAEPSPEPIKAQSIQWPPRKPAAVEPAAVEPAAERVVEPAAAEPRAEAAAEPAAAEPAAVEPPAEPAVPEPAAPAAPEPRPRRPDPTPAARSERHRRTRRSQPRSTTGPAAPPTRAATRPVAATATRALKRVMSWRGNGSDPATEGAQTVFRTPTEATPARTERPERPERSRRTERTVRTEPTPARTERTQRPARPKPTTRTERTTRQPTPAPHPDAPAPTPQPEHAPLGFRERGQLRQRASYLRHLREVQIRDLGAFVFELYRFDKWRGDLVGMKLAELGETDRELRGLESVLGEERPLPEVREAGIGGVCSRCGNVHGSVDRFCSACGAPVADSTVDSRRSGLGGHRGR